MPTSFLAQTSAVSQSGWNFSLYDGLDAILIGRGVQIHVNWTELVGFQRMTPLAHLVFSIRHAQSVPAI